MELHIPSIVELLSISSTSFILVFLAEFGDKSQLVCMTLAVKHRPWPVLLGAVAAFAVLNLLAVVFGAMIASWVPELWLTLVVAGLFGFFGFQSLLIKNDGSENENSEFRSTHSLFITTLLMILVAEFGDKTQLAVAGLATTYSGLPVWIGAMLALSSTTLLGIIVGQRLLKRFPLELVHKFSGLLFLLLALVALFQVIA